MADEPILAEVRDMSEGGRKPDIDEPVDEPLSPREIVFVDALATGVTPREAAMGIGLSERSGRRWRKRPEIIEAVRIRQSENVAVGKSILAAGMAKAAIGLVAMASGDEPAESARVSAARAVVEATAKLVEAEELERRLAARGLSGDSGFAHAAA